MLEPVWARPHPALPPGSFTLFSSLRGSVTQNVFGHFTSIYFIFADSSLPNDITMFCIALLMETPGTHAAIRCTESLVPKVLSMKLESISYNLPITKNGSSIQEILGSSPCASPCVVLWDTMQTDNINSRHYLNSDSSGAGTVHCFVCVFL